MISARRHSPILCLLVAFAAQGADLAVDGSNAVCDDVTGTPYCSISAAIAAAVTDDVITVNSGAYAENVRFNGKNVTLQSASGPSSTSIAGSNGSAVIIGPGGTLEGFRVTSDPTANASGVEVIDAGAIITGNIFEQLTDATLYGTGIGGNGASATIDGNIFRNNQCGSGRLSAVIVFVNTSSPLVINNLFENNSCRAITSQMPVTAGPIYVNNTIVGNPSGIRVDRRIALPNQVYRNNIIYGNTVGVEYEFGTEANNPVFEGNLVFGNTTDFAVILDPTGTEGNISVDPMFADETNGDYRLLPTSPAIDSAIEDLSLTQDLLGVMRPIDGDGDMTTASDRGAYEAAPPVADAGLDQFVTAGDAVSLNASASSDADGMIAAYSWVQTTGSTVTLNNAANVTATFIAPAIDGALSFRVTLTDDLGFISSDEITVTVSTPPAPTRPSGGGGIGTLMLLGLTVLTGIRSARCMNCPRMHSSA